MEPVKEPMRLKSYPGEFVFMLGEDIVMKITPEGIFASGVQIGQRKHEAELIYEVIRQYTGPAFGGDYFFGEEDRLEALRDRLCREIGKGNHSGIYRQGVSVAHFEMPSVGR